MPATPQPASSDFASPSMPHARFSPDGGTPFPRPLTQLVARDQDVDAVATLLRDPAVRLLTLTGPGGVGKTRLAIAAATAVTAEFPDGAAFVDLSPVFNPEIVMTTIARRLGLRDISVESMDARLAMAIGDRRLLLVVDNFEQVVVAAPRVRWLLDVCPGVILLITSRIRLRVSGEREYPVAPLPLGGPDEHGQAEPSGAIRLFFERARDIRPDFHPTPETIPTVTEIVRRVDGLPLAIELAAARIKALPPGALLQRMEHQLPLLSGGSRDLPLRQQTMRDTITWSHDLLDDAEKALFRRLGVFVGGFTLEEAEAIVTDPPNGAGGPLVPDPVDVMDGITSLIEHSLLLPATGPDGESRYQMLATVREYAVDRLAASDERAALQRRHAGYFLALVEANASDLFGPDQTAWITRLKSEKDNLRAAMEWAVDQGEAEIATRFGAVLWPAWERRGYLGEGRSFLARILDLSPGPDAAAARCSALTGAGVLAALQGDYDQAIRHSEAALAGWQRLGDQRGVARTLLCLAEVARYRDDYAAADALGQESLVAYLAADDRWGMGHALTHLGMVSWVQGDQAAGAAHYEEALAHLRAVGDAPGIFETLLELGKGACDGGDLTRATALFEECLALSASLDDAAGRGASLTELGVVARRRGDVGRATGLFLQARTLAQESGDRRQIAYLAAHLGDAGIASGAIGGAAAHYAEALGHFLQMGNRVGIAQCLGAISRCAAMHDRLMPAIRLLANSAALFIEIGATPPPDRNPDNDAAALRSKVPPADFARAWEAGQALRGDDAAAEALALATELAAASDGENEAAVAPGTATETLAAARGLTPREIEVMGLLAQGMSDREIAETLSISERTAGNHVQHAMQKIGVESRTAAAVYAVRHGLG